MGKQTALVYKTARDNNFKLSVLTLNLRIIHQDQRITRKYDEGKKVDFYFILFQY